MADQELGIAARLRAARMQQGLALDALARELKNPMAVLEAIERGDWSRLGAPVFARHLVGRYADRLGIRVDLDEVAATLVAPELRSQVPASRIGRVADFSARHAAYVGGTLLVVPLVFALLNMTANRPSQVRALDPAPVAAAPVVPVTTPLAASESPAAVNVAAADPAPAAPGAPVLDETSPSLAAATAPIAEAAAPAPAPSTPTTVAASLAGGVAASSAQIELRFSGDSWIEVFGRDGASIERAMARIGEVRRFPVADVGRVTIGNVDATEVVVDGSSVNLEPVRAANVARFALSSDGSIEAVAR